ncbi:MAG: response regulator [Acidimicrobiales bacterium]
MLRESLRSAGHEADVVGTGAEVVWLAKEVPFDVVILDRMLPDADGVDVCRQRRELDRWVPVLMLTGRVEWPSRWATCVSTLTIARPRAGQLVDLTQKEFTILERLMRAEEPWSRGRR